MQTGQLSESLTAAIMKMKAEEEALITLTGTYAVLTDGSKLDGPLNCTVKLERFVKVCPLELTNEPHDATNRRRRRTRWMTRRS